MNLLKRWIAFYVFGNIHVAIAAYCLTKITFLHFNIQDQRLANFVFFSTILSYNMIRLFQIDRINSSVAIWFRSNQRPLIILNILAFIGTIYYLFQFEWNNMLILIPFLIATIFYVLPPYGKSTMGLRNIPGLKLFIIAITWTGVTFLFPLFVSGIEMSDVSIYLGIQRFLFVLAITIPFDIRDAIFDKKELSTLPQVLGLTTSKVIAIMALLLFMFIDLRISLDNLNLIKTDLIVIAIASLLILFTTIQRKRYYTAFWIEGLPVLWYGIYLLFVV